LPGIERKNGLLAKPTHGDKIRFAPPPGYHREQVLECVDISGKACSSFIIIFTVFSAPKHFHLDAQLITESPRPRRTALQSSDLLRRHRYRQSDGLTVPFALGRRPQRAVSSTNLISLQGWPEIAAGSIAMAWAATWPAKPKSIIYNSELQREYAEVETVPHKEKEEVKEFFCQPGLSEGGTAAAVEEMTKDKVKGWIL